MGTGDHPIAVLLCLSRGEKISLFLTTIDKNSWLRYWEREDRKGCEKKRRTSKIDIMRRHKGENNVASIG